MENAGFGERLRNIWLFTKQVWHSCRTRWPYHSAFSSTEEVCFIAGQISSCACPLGITEQDLFLELVRKDQALVPPCAWARFRHYVKSTHRCFACAQGQIYCCSSKDNGYDDREMNEGNPLGTGGKISLPPTWDLAERASFFTCDDGSIGLSCPNARVGDFVCDFAPLGRLVVRREHGNDWRVIGTASCNHIFSMTEGVPAIFSSIAKSMVEQQGYIEFLDPACSPDSSTVADLLLQDEAHILDSTTSCPLGTQLFGKAHATNSALSGKRLAISVSLWDLTWLAPERAHLDLSDDTDKRVFTEEADE